MGKATATLSLGAALQGGTKATFNAISSGLKQISTELKKTAKDLIKMGKSDAADAVGHVSMAVDKASESLKDMGKSSKQAAKGMQEAIVPMKNMENQIKGIQGVWKHYQDTSNKTAESTKANAKYTRNLSDTLGGLAKQINDAGGKGDEWLKRIKASNLIQAKNNKLITESGRLHRDLSKTQLQSIGISGKTYDAYKRSQDIQTRYNREVGKAQYKTVEYQKAVQQLGRQFQWTNKTTAKWAPALLKAEKALTSVSMGAKNVSASTKQMISGLKLTDVTIASLGKNVKVTANGIQVLNKAGLQELGISSRKAAQEAGLLATSFKKVSTSKAASSIREIAAAYPEATRASSELRGKLRGLHAEFKKSPEHGKVASKEFKLFAKTIQNSLTPISLFESGLRSIGSSIKSFASYAAGASIIAGFAMALRSAATAIIDFDQSLKDLQAITGATDREVAVMGETILQVASTTKFSAEEVALGMKTLGQAGLSASEAVRTMQAVSDLATGTLTDMATSVDLVTTAMRVFDISASDSGHVADVFANAVNRSKLTVEKLRIAMNYVGPVAKRAGVTFEEVAGSMMVLANRGIRASTIGTGLRQVFRKLVDPSKKLMEGIKAAGLSIEDFNPQAHSMSTIIQNLSEVVVTAEDAFQMFGMRGASAISALTDGGVAGFDAMYEAVTRSGAAAKMAEKQMEGLGVKIKNMWDKTKNLAIALGDTGLASVLHVVLNRVRDLIDVLIVLVSNPIAKLILQIGAVTIALALFTATVKSLASIGVMKVFFSSFIGFFSKIPALIGTATFSLNMYSVSMGRATVATGGLTRALYGSAVAFAATGWGAVVIAIAAVIATIVSLISIEKRHQRLTQESIDKSKNLVDVYKDIGNSIVSYRDKLIKAGDDTKKVNSINKDYREKLMKFTEITEDATEGEIKLALAAREAASAINPLTGEISSASDALDRYQQLLKSQEIKELANAYKLMSESSLDLSTWDNLFDLTGVLVKRFKETGLSYKDFAETVKSWGDDMSDSQRKLQNDIYATELEAEKLLTLLMLGGKVDLSSTEEQLLAEAKAIAANTVATKQQRGQLKLALNERKKAAAESNSGSAENLIDRLAKIEEKEKAYAEGKIQRNIEIQNSLSKLSKEELAIHDAKLQSLAKEAQANKDAWINKEKSDKAYLLKVQELDKSARELRKEGRNNENVARRDHILEIEKTMDKELASNANHNSNLNGLTFAGIKKELEIREKFRKQIKKVMENTYDIESMKSKMKEYIAVEQQALAESLRNIELASSGDREGTDEGIYEQQKLEATASSHRMIEAEYKLHYENLLNSREKGDKDLEAWHKKYLDAIKTRQKSELVLLKSFVSDRDKAQDKINDLTTKRATETKKNTDKIGEIERKASDKIVDLIRSREEKIRDLIRKREEVVRNTENNIADIHESINDKIRVIGQRGMSDRQKERDNERRAYEKYMKGRADLSRAVANKDKEAAEKAKGTLESSGALYEGLADSSKAVNGLRNIERELVKAEEAIGEISKGEIDKAIINAQNLFTFKQNKILRLANIALNKENERHSKAMSNLALEVAEWEKKLAVAVKMLNLTKSKITEDLGEKSDPSKSVNNVPIVDKAGKTYDNESDRINYENRSKFIQDEVEGMKLIDGIWTNINDKAESYSTSLSDQADVLATEIIKRMGDLKNRIESEEPVNLNLEIGALEGLQENYNEIKRKIAEDPLQLNATSLDEDLQIAYGRFQEFMKKQDSSKINVEIDKESLSAADAAIKKLAQTVVVTVKTSESKETGGRVIGALSRADGGRIPGPDSKKDNTLVNARSGEWFIRNESVDTWTKKVGSWFMEAVNAPMSSAGKTLMSVLSGAKDTSVSKSGVSVPSVSGLTGNSTNDIVSEMSEFGTIMFNFDNGQKSIPVLVKQDNVSDLLTGISKLGRLSS